MRIAAAAIMPASHAAAQEHVSFPTQDGRLIYADL
jgi:hypothetical protein